MSTSERPQAWGGQGRVEGTQAPCSLLTSYPLRSLFRGIPAANDTKEAHECELCPAVS